MCVLCFREYRFQAYNMGNMRYIHFMIKIILFFFFIQNYQEMKFAILLNNRFSGY